MTYYESYINLDSFEKAKEKAKKDTKIAVTILGNNPDRIKAIEDAINKAEIYFRERREEDLDRWKDEQKAKGEY